MGGGPKVADEYGFCRDGGSMNHFECTHSFSISMPHGKQAASHSPPDRPAGPGRDAGGSVVRGADAAGRCGAQRGAGGPGGPVPGREVRSPALPGGHGGGRLPAAPRARPLRPRPAAGPRGGGGARERACGRREGAGLAKRRSGAVGKGPYSTAVCHARRLVSPAA